jgi:L-lactate dehydrogenase complex protein LldE
MKVSLFVTCLVDLFNSDVGKSTVELLEELGCDIDFPASQTCCGQPTFNSGYVKESIVTIKNMIKAFEHSKYVVTPSGSCATMVKEYPQILSGDPIWEEKARGLANKTYELTQFIVDVLKIKDVGAKLNGKAAYHTSCHMTRLLGVKDSPFDLLNNVSELEMIPLPNSHNCCGFGGTFSVKMGQISEQMVDEKISDFEKTGADYLISGDCGCLMNIRGRIDRQKKPIKVMHIAEVLNNRSKE